MRKKIIILCMFLVTTCFACHKEEEPTLLNKQLQMPIVGDSIAVVTTSEGVFKMKLLSDVAPKTVSYFQENVLKGLYNDIEISKSPVASKGEFVVSSCDKMEKSEDDPNFEPEKDPEVLHFTGAVAMGRSLTESGEIFYDNKGFYVVVGSHLEKEMTDELSGLGFSTEASKAFEEVGGQPWMDLDRNNPIFAQVYEGLDVLADVFKGDLRPSEEGFGFMVPVYIEKIELQTYTEED